MSEQQHALNAFKITWGARWKIVLQDAWRTGGYPASTPRKDIEQLEALKGLNQL